MATPCPNRLRLVVAYDGRPFDGWQSQARGNTIQDHLEAALSQLCGGGRVPVHGSGRTDAGVHASGQVAHADVPDRHAPHARALAAGDQLVPAPDDPGDGRRFPGGRFSRAVFRPGQNLSLPHLERAGTRPARTRPGLAFSESAGFVDTPARRGDLLLGQHDFAGFAANRGKRDGNTVRTLRRIDIRRRSPLITLDYEGDGFLYKMVRLLTGTLVRCAQGRASLDWISELLAATGTKSSFAAPAEGLYLMRVLYGRQRARGHGMGLAAAGEAAAVAARDRNRILLHLEAAPQPLRPCSAGLR